MSDIYFDDLIIKNIYDEIEDFTTFKNISQVSKQTYRISTEKKYKNQRKILHANEIVSMYPQYVKKSIDDNKTTERIYLTITAIIYGLIILAYFTNKLFHNDVFVNNLYDKLCNILPYFVIPYNYNNYNINNTKIIFIVMYFSYKKNDKYFDHML